MYSRRETSSGTRPTLGSEFWLSDDLVGTDYTSVFSAQLTKFGPGGGSPPHSHTHNHAFHFLRGTGSVQIGEQTWQIEPGTFVKVPAQKQHSVTNTGSDSTQTAHRPLIRGP